MLKIKSFIKSQENMEILKVYSDPGFTGANLERPMLQELLEDVRQKRIYLSPETVPLTVTDYARKGYEGIKNSFVFFK